MVDFAELTWAALLHPHCCVSSHAIPHGMLSTQVLGGADSRVGESME